MTNTIPYIFTLRRKEFGDYLMKPFHIDLFTSKSNEIKLFNGWTLSNNSTNNSLINDNGIVIEFYETFYIITTKTLVYTLPKPSMIYHIIEDMYRIGIQLHWNFENDVFINKFKPIDYLNSDNIRDYYEKLLQSMDKSDELL